MITLEEAIEIAKECRSDIIHGMEDNNAFIFSEHVD